MKSVLIGLALFVVVAVQAIIMWTMLSLFQEPVGAEQIFVAVASTFPIVLVTMTYGLKKSSNRTATIVTLFIAICVSIALLSINHLKTKDEKSVPSGLYYDPDHHHDRDVLRI